MGLRVAVAQGEVSVPVADGTGGLQDPFAGPIGRRRVFVASGGNYPITLQSTSPVGRRDGRPSLRQSVFGWERARANGFIKGAKRVVIRGFALGVSMQNWGVILATRACSVQR